MDPRIKQLTDYAPALRFADLPAETVHECKRKIIDSIGCVFGAFEWAPFGGRGGPFRVNQTHIKFFPSVIHSQSPVTAALQVRAGLDCGDIRSVTLDTYWVAERYVDRAIDPLLEKLWKLEDVANVKEVIDLLVARTRHQAAHRGQNT